MLQNCNLWNVATVFFERPEKDFELLEISRKIKLAHTSVKNHLGTLIKLNIVKKGTVGFGNKKNPCYSANRANSVFIHYKKLYNYDLLQKSGIISFIQEKCQPNTIVCFGSFAKGEDSVESDIDLFVESSEIELSLDKFERKLTRKIELHFKKNFKKYPPELKNNIMNGATLFGFLEGYDA